MFRSTGRRPRANSYRPSGPDRRPAGLPGPGCVLYFVKKHPRREWCSAGCGTRARAARHYERTEAAGR
ncbi:CGNR zinc finger domain-containing protein [Kitasatospora sp. NPDC050467]|uniref:CGNR zinc finger domain-containing protein n=1 Tax=unclassified Kitasatospora TaxID=2633591 RepID=UPI00378AA5DF